MPAILTDIAKSASTQSLFEQVETERKTMIDTVMAWSKVNSGSPNLEGLAVMEELILDAFSVLSPDVEIIDLPDGERVDDDGNVQIAKNGRCLRIYKRPEANRRVLMTGHYDTVFALNHPFQVPVWLDDNTINGPGVADMKGGIIVMLHALKAFEASPNAASVGWEVILSPDEETGSLKSADILAERAKSADIGLTYEPALADGTLAGARKGSGNYALVVTGRAAHAGREFFEGRNAVVLLAEMIGRLSNLTNGMPGLTVNAAVISGGVASNVVPDKALCRFNVRLEKPEDAGWFTAQLDALVAEFNEREGYKAVLHGGINRPPKAISEANQILMDAIAACGAELGFDVSYVPTGGCCEGNNLAAAGLPNVDTLGVRGGLIHSADEFVMVDSFTERAKLSLLILLAFAGGALDDVVAAKAHAMAE